MVKLYIEVEADPEDIGEEPYSASFEADGRKYNVSDVRPVEEPLEFGGYLYERNRYNSDTLVKAYEALMLDGMSRQQATNCVTRLQNAGILFRERLP